MSGILRTSEGKKEFLAAYGEHGTLTSAAKATGLARRTIYDWRQADPEFEEEFETIRETLIEVLEQSLYRQALGGDVQAAMFMLKAMRPQIYRDRYEIRNVQATEVDTEGARERLMQKLTAIDVSKTIDVSKGDEKAK